jgi:hypothetical protein
MYLSRGSIPLLLFACAACAATLAGCERGDSGGVQRRQLTRNVVDVEWRERWIVGGAEGDTTVLMPANVVGDGERVYVLEPQLHRVVALRTSDGSVLWRAGGEGRGPQELRNPSAFTLDRNGNVLVMDQGNGRLAVLSPAGTFTRHIAVQELGYPSGLCALDDGGVLVAPLVTEHPLVRLSPQGKLVQRYELPWRDLADAVSLAVQGDLEKDGSGGCVYAMVTGRGFVRYRDGKLSAHDYVEWFDVPRAERTGDPYRGGRRESMATGPQASQGVGIGEEGIAVGFSGNTNDAGRLIDLYDRTTGAYTRTYRAPRWFSRMSRAGNLYVFTTRMDGYPALLAAEPVETPPR